MSSSYEMRKLLRIVEGLENHTGTIDHPDVQYLKDTTNKGDIKKVIAKLSSYKSQVFTKLGEKFLRIKQLDEEVTALKEQIKNEDRAMIAALFDAEDAVHTRVVETVSFVFKLTKDPAPTVSYKYADVLAELEKHLTPELLDVLQDIKEKYKSITQKEPALTGTRAGDNNMSENINESVSDTLAKYFTKFDAWVRRWGESYDQKLERLYYEAAMSEPVKRPRF